MTFGTISFGFGGKRDGRRISHLVCGAATHCGLPVGNPGAVWSFSDTNFIPTSAWMDDVSMSQSESVVYARQECLRHHITCRHCLTLGLKWVGSI